MFFVRFVGFVVTNKDVGDVVAVVHSSYRRSAIKKLRVVTRVSKTSLKNRLEKTGPHVQTVEYVQPQPRRQLDADLGAATAVTVGIQPR